jgi:hypothetical protein
MAFSEETKFEVKKRAHQTCCICKTIGIEIHHIIPISVGGLDNLDNAAPLCPTCHEIYGQNPSKRKFIRESRQIWFEICDKRFKGDELLYSKLMDKIDRIEGSLIKLVDDKDMKQSKFMSIGDIQDYLVALHYPSSTDESSNLDFMYKFIFEIITTQEGDPEEEVEMFERKKMFVNYFGSFFCKRLIAYLLWKTKLNWVVSVTEEEVFNFVGILNVLMILILRNYDICDPPGRFKCYITENGDFKFSLLDDAIDHD